MPDRGRTSPSGQPDTTPSSPACRQSTRGVGCIVGSVSWTGVEPPTTHAIYVSGYYLSKFKI